MKAHNSMIKKPLVNSLDPSGGIDELVKLALDEKQNKMSTLIRKGVTEVSSQKEDIGKEARKIQVKMVAEETRRNLEQARYKDSNTMTGGRPANYQSR